MQEIRGDALHFSHSWHCPTSHLCPPSHDEVFMRAWWVHEEVHWCLTANDFQDHGASLLVDNPRERWYRACGMRAIYCTNRLEYLLEFLANGRTFYCHTKQCPFEDASRAGQLLQGQFPLFDKYKGQLLEEQRLNILTCIAGFPGSGHYNVNLTRFRHVPLLDNKQLNILLKDMKDKKHASSKRSQNHTASSSSRGMTRSFTMHHR